MGEVVDHPSKWFDQIQRADRKYRTKVAALRLRSGRFERAAQFEKAGLAMILAGGAMLAAGIALAHINPIGGAVLAGEGVKTFSGGLASIGYGVTAMGVLTTLVGGFSAMCAQWKYRRGIALHDKRNGTRR
ncbi:MAG: hypothetical protein KGJ49_05015 [Alphaproteobacteria bacterium]|nr:hypothetical protein [Alphaproteobacteria bacterium]